jgi:hypothetical protein
MGPNQRPGGSILRFRPGSRCAIRFSLKTIRVNLNTLATLRLNASREVMLVMRPSPSAPSRFRRLRSAPPFRTRFCRTSADSRTLAGLELRLGMFARVEPSRSGRGRERPESGPTSPLTWFRRRSAFLKGFRTPAIHWREGPHGGGRRKSLEGGNRGGVRTAAGVDLWGICRRWLI